MYEKEVKRFTFHLYTLLESGIDLNTALSKTDYITENREFRDILEQIEKDVEKGTSLYEALSKFGYCFPPYYMGMVHLTDQFPGKINLKYILKGLIQYDLI